MAFNLHRLQRHIGAVADENYLTAIRFAQNQMVMQALPIRSLLNDQQIDAIFLADSLSNQQDIVQSAIRQHKSVLYDQLGTISLADLQSLQQLAIEERVLLFPNLPTCAMPLLTKLRQQKLNLTSVRTFFTSDADLPAYIPTLAALLVGLNLSISDLKLINQTEDQLDFQLHKTQISMERNKQTDLLENALLVSDNGKKLLTSIFAPTKIETYPKNDEEPLIIGEGKKATQYLLQAFEEKISDPFPPNLAHLGSVIQDITQQLQA
ncbi:MAG: hypothetical protein LKH26_01020 [Lactobacillus sp.]|nr:hypothetical protein [Lactobacillus sp.]